MSNGMIIFLNMVIFSEESFKAAQQIEPGLSSRSPAERGPYAFRWKRIG
jgi:hypothetical protein